VALQLVIMQEYGWISQRNVNNIFSHLTDGQWNDWDPQNPPLEYIELADSKQTYEKPDQWIRPDKLEV